MLGIGTAAWITGCGQTAGHPTPASSTPATASAVSSATAPAGSPVAKPVPTDIRAPFQTSQGITWLVAACGNPAIVEDQGHNSLIPNATHWAICVGTPGSKPVLVGQYSEASVFGRDAEALQGGYRYTTRTDEHGMTWVFLVEGSDPSPLNRLDRFGFSLN